MGAKTNHIVLDTPNDSKLDVISFITWSLEHTVACQHALVTERNRIIFVDRCCWGNDGIQCLQDLVVLHQHCLSCPKEDEHHIKIARLRGSWVNEKCLTIVSHFMWPFETHNTFRSSANVYTELAKYQTWKLTTQHRITLSTRGNMGD